MTEPGFAPPANQLGQIALGSLDVTRTPASSQGLALDATGFLPGSVVAPNPADQQYLRWNQSTLNKEWATLGGPASYTPALTATTTSPSLGTSPTQAGRSIQVGKLVWGRAVIVFGTTPAAGTGTYQISLPVTAASSGPSAGSGTLLDNSASLVRNVTCELASTTVLQMRIDNTGLGLVTNAVPWTWAVNDQISLVFFYEAA